jgi:nucleoid-associated protein YgaU
MHQRTTTLSRARSAASTPARRDQPAAGSQARRGRRAVTTVATTVSTAAVLAAALAAPAGAASRYAVWDRVAGCESSHNWHIDTGNGYYGGLQFSSSTWAAYGGHRYARQASGASRLEQIEVARRVLASQGPGAWPVCGPRAGLTRANGHATHARLPREVARHRQAPKSRHHARQVHHARGHADGVDQHARKTRHGHHGTYRVRPGDTLSAIARKLHVRGGWHALFRANRDHVHNADVLHVGQLLLVP